MDILHSRRYLLLLGVWDGALHEVWILTGTHISFRMAPLANCIFCCAAPDSAQRRKRAHRLSRMQLNPVQIHFACTRNSY